jgi:hypothetical protein
MIDTPIEVSPGVEFAQTLWGDEYTGTPAAMLEAGIVLPYQLPGAPGNGRTMVSFYPDGRLVGKGNAKAHELVGYLKVCHSSRGRLRVVKGIGKAAVEARRKVHFERRKCEEEEESQRTHCWPFPIICGEPA